MYSTPIERTSMAQALPHVVGRRTPPQPPTSTVGVAEVDRSEALLADWQSLVEQSSEPFVFFQTPVWVDCVAAEERAQIAYVVMRDEQARPLGVVPMLRCSRGMKFNVGHRSLHEVTLSTLHLFGATPLGPQDDAAYDALFQGLHERFADVECVELDRVIVGSPFWKYLTSSRRLRRRFLPYLPDGSDGVPVAHSIILPETVEEYSKRFDSKWHRELRRQVRRFEDECGPIALRCFERGDEVKEFVRAAEIVSQRSWQRACGVNVLRYSPAWIDKLERLAAERAFRSYILYCGESPCAVEMGYQHRDTFHAIFTYYDPQYARYSPGSILLYRLISDMICRRPVRLFCLGNGDFDYKRRFGNVVYREATFFLLRNTYRNQLRRALHAGFRSTIRAAKSLRAKRRRDVDGYETCRLPESRKAAG